jgi:hypothetical protein
MMLPNGSWYAELTIEIGSTVIYSIDIYTIIMYIIAAITIMFYAAMVRAQVECGKVRTAIAVRPLWIMYYVYILLTTVFRLVTIHMFTPTHLADVISALFVAILSILIVIISYVHLLVAIKHSCCIQCYLSRFVTIFNSCNVCVLAETKIEKVLPISV